MDQHRTNLEGLHDQVADLKSFFDGHMKAASMEEELDEQNLALNLKHSNSFLFAPS